MDELVGGRANADVGGHAMVGEVHPVPVVERRGPITRHGHSGGDAAEAPSLHVIRWLNARDIEQGAGEVEIAHHRVDHRASGDLRREPHQQRHPERFLVHEALVIPAVVAEEEALVGRVDHQRSPGQVFVIEEIEELAHVVIDRRHAAKVVLDVALVLPVLLLHRGETVGNRHLQIGRRQVRLDSHFGVARGLGAVRIVVVEGWRRGNVDVLV